MLAPLLALSLVSCTPIGSAVADRTADALAHLAPKPLAEDEAARRLRELATTTQALLATTIDREHHRSSTAHALDRFAAEVEAYLALMPKLPKARVLDALWRLVELTRWVESAVDLGPPDWPEGTWREYRDALGCQSHGRELIAVGLRFAELNDVRGPARTRLEAAREPEGGGF